MSSFLCTKIPLEQRATPLYCLHIFSPLHQITPKKGLWSCCVAQQQLPKTARGGVSTKWWSSSSCGGGGVLANPRRRETTCSSSRQSRRRPPSKTPPRAQSRADDDDDNVDVDAVVFEPIIDDGGGGGGGGPPPPPTQKEVGKKTKAPPPSSSSSFGNGIFDSLIKSYDEFDASEGLTKLKRNVKHSDRMAKAMQYKAGKVAKSLRVKVNGTTNANARKSVGVLSRTRITGEAARGEEDDDDADARSTLKKKKKKTPGKTSKEKSKEASKIPVTYPDATKPEIYKFNDAEREAMGELEADGCTSCDTERELVRLFAEVSSKQVKRERRLLETAGHFHSWVRVERVHVRRRCERRVFDAQIVSGKN